MNIFQFIKYNFLLWFSYAYLFISCFYSAYLVGIISFLFFILLLYVSNELEKNKRLLLFFNYIKLTILAVLTTAFILLPAAVYVLSNKASDSTGYEGTTANLISIISNLFLGMTQSNFGFNPYLYSGLFTLILFPFFFLSIKINKRVKLLWGALLLFLALCCKIPFLYIFMHCFDSPDYFAYRFSYLISFVLIIMAAYVYKNVDSYNKYILLIEGLVLNIINFQSLIATKTARIWLASKKAPIMEFGLRRAQGPDGAMSATRAAYIGGAAGTSNTLAGKELGIPDNLVYRQPFPGPGLGIRVIGDITKDKLDILREADYIFREEIKNAGLEKDLNQYFAVLTNIKSVGVMGDGRTYDYTIALRSVKTTDFMTATWSKIPYEVLEKVSGRIVNEVKHVNRVVYDITSKPPATIEWE